MNDVAYGPEPEHRLDLRLPEGTGPHPLIIWLHGGGFTSGSEDDVAPLVADQVDRGFAVASVRYRLAPEHPFPAGLADVKLAVRWLKSRSRPYDLDPERFIAWGHSAGGNLAAMVAVSPGELEPRGLPDPVAERSSAVAAFVDEAGPSDLTTWWRQAGTMSLSSTLEYLSCSEIDRCSRHAMRLASPVTWVDASDPPGYLAYGRFDELVDADRQGLPLYRALVAAKGSGAGHWDLVSTGRPVAQGHEIEREMDRVALECFLDSSLGLPGPPC